jgi:methylated-DNA-protein-cysteine methyltransferase-like protein
MTTHDLHERIVATVRAVPRGRVASYGQIAAHAGAKGRARLVGWVLRHHDGKPELPWHRILRANGGIAFPDGSDARAEQIRRLKKEGVVVVGGRVDLARHGWKRGLDELLWGPPMAPVRRARRRSGQ